MRSIFNKYCIFVITFLQASLGFADDLDWPIIKKEMKPWTRWWWHGNAVTKGEIERHLELFKEAGIGGVEITSIYGVEGQEKNTIQYLSPEYIEIIKFTAQKADELGLGVDIPPGSGWRCGGPHVEVKDADAKVVIEKFEVPQNAWFKHSFKNRPQALVAVSQYGDQYELLEQLDWMGNISWQAFSTDWTIYAVSQRWSGAKVKRPAPGGEGFSFNPFSKRSFENMIQPFDELYSALPAGTIRSQFHDSFEYTGNWTDTLFDEFKERRGYDLRSHIAALNGIGNREDIARIKCDYRETLSDLVLENFILPWKEWAHSHGQLVRNQSHGSPANLLDLYGAVDIPETEIFRFDNHIDVLKFASSAANIMGRPLVSSESFTWQDEHFHVTLDTMKRSVDWLFAAGINHIFFHGTTYSPKEAAWPGWLFYASSQINPQNTIWHDLPALNSYVTRCQSVLQTSKPDNRILVYWPVYDVWTSATGLERNMAVHHNQWITENPAGKVAERLRRNGHLYDFISDYQIKGSRATEGKIKLPGGLYDCVIVPSCETIPIETMSALKRLAETGATVIFEGPFNPTVPGYHNHEMREVQLLGLLSESGLIAGGKPVYGTKRVEEGKIVHADDVISALETNGFLPEQIAQKPGVFFNRKTHEQGHVYYISNHSKNIIKDFIPLVDFFESAVLMNPMNGRTGLAGTKTVGQTNSVYLILQPGETIIVKTFNSQVTGKRWAYHEPVGSAAGLTGEWSVKFVSGGPELPPEKNVDQLESWTKWNERAQNFAGTAKYTIRFNRPGSGFAYILDLGKVAESAVVYLNGNKIATLFSRPFQVKVNDLKISDNLLEIEVTNLAANRIRDLDKRNVRWRIFHDINLVNLDYKKFDASTWPVMDSGLLGPVTIQSLQRVN